MKQIVSHYINGVFWFPELPGRTYYYDLFSELPENTYYYGMNHAVCKTYFDKKVKLF